MSALLFLPAVAGTPAEAFDGNVNSFAQLAGNVCEIKVSSYESAESAGVFPGNGEAAGGSYFLFGAIINQPPITAGFIEQSCGLINVTNLVQNCADGTYATDGYMGVSFQADDPNDMLTYQYEYAISGVTGTSIINTRTLVDTSGETEAEIAEYLQRRANALVGAQPELIRLLNPGGEAKIAASSKGFSLATGGSTPIWASLHGQWGESGDSDTRYLLGALGAHLWLNDRTILGLMLEVDQMNEDDPLVSIKGTGWLLGPYLAGQVQDQPLFYETRLLWGKTDNDIAQTGQPTASFGSTRFLAQAKLKGEFAMGKAVAAPFLDASYVRDQSEAYVDGLNNPIAAQEVQQSQVALGLDVSQAFAANGGMLTPSGSFSAIYRDTTGSVGLTEPAHDGWRGKLKLGVTFTKGLSQFEAQAFVDGLGTPDYRNYGLSFDFLTRF